MFDDDLSPETPEDVRRRKQRRGVLAAAGAGVVGLAVAFAAARYHIAAPNAVLVKTGFGVRGGMSVVKRTMRWPFQMINTVPLSPFHGSAVVDGMSKEIIEFKVPIEGTFAPCDPDTDPEGFRNYARKCIGFGTKELEQTLYSILKGEVRVLTANLELKELNSDRSRFRNEVTKNLQEDFKSLGIVVLNINVGDLHDRDAKNTYFENMRKKPLEEVSNRAKIDVAEAQKQGEIGEQTRVGETREKKAEILARARIAENTQAEATAQSDKKLKVAQAGFDREAKIAAIEAKAAQEEREAKLQQHVQQARTVQEVERLRAEKLAGVTVEAQMQAKEAEGKAQAMTTLADAQLYSKQQEAKGALTLLQAQAQGLGQMLQACGNQSALLQFVLANEKGLFETVAREGAKAVHGMQPKLNIWHTGGSSGGTLMDPMRDLVKGVPPLMDYLTQMTGIKFGADSIQSLLPKTESPTLDNNKKEATVVT